MSLKPTLEEQELLADTFRRSELSMTRREWLTEIAAVLAFIAVAGILWGADPPKALDPVPVALSLMVMVLATRVRFDTPLGFTVATQLAFVPLLFAVPLTIVPLAVVTALMIAHLPEVLSGKHPTSRLLREITNSWFSIGPVAVFALASIQPDHASPALLVAALAAQFAVDFVVSTLRFRIERAAKLSAQLRETWVYGIDAALSGIALVVAEAIHRTPLAALAPVPLLALLAVFARERHQRLESLLELNAAYRGTALVLGDVVEADDGYTGEHSKGVVRLALAVGEHLGLNAEQRRNLEFGALLHDVGKIAIPKEIINKPGKLDPHEWDIITAHTTEGQKMLDRIGGFMRNVGLIVRSHHERWDGTGYPDGLAGEAIPLEARIITCCDSWNAMRTDRSYRNALSHEVALAELNANSGRQFDPRVVASLLTVIGAPEAVAGTASQRPIGPVKPVLDTRQPV
jgi:putative nucleotidyltransferase with HDIG domain